jgi:versiconal hemiacetal acetate reductase
MQNCYSLLYRACSIRCLRQGAHIYPSTGEEEREMIRYCEFAGIGVIPYAALGFGKLARPLGSDETTRFHAQGRFMPWFAKSAEAEDEILRGVEKVAKDKG